MFVTKSGVQWWYNTCIILYRWMSVGTGVDRLGGQQGGGVQNTQRVIVRVVGVEIQGSA